RRLGGQLPGRALPLRRACSAAVHPPTLAGPTPLSWPTAPRRHHQAAHTTHELRYDSTQPRLFPGEVANQSPPPWTHQQPSNHRSRSTTQALTYGSAVRRPEEVAQGLAHALGARVVLCA